MKISDKTLRAARKAAKDRGKTLDAWAEEVLSAAAAAKPSTIETKFREIANKLDRIADRQRIGETATDRLTAALQEFDSFFQRSKKSAGQILDKAEARTSSAAGDVAEKVRELINRASEFAGTLSTRGSDANQDGTRPAPEARTRDSTSSGAAAVKRRAKKTTATKTRKATGARKKAAAGRQSRSKRDATRSRRSRRPA